MVKLGKTVMGKGGKIPIKSCTIEDHPQFAVVTDDPDWGHGIFSLHVTMYDANHNCKITGGQVVPVDWVDGQMIVPPLHEAIKRRSES